MGNLAIVKALLNAGANASVTDNNRQTALNYGKKKIIKFIKIILKLFLI